MFVRLRGLAQAAESAGFDSLWVTDDVVASGRPHLEAYSLLGALSAWTRTVHLGAIPTGVDSRAPAIVAKIVTGIDVISHGRGLLTVGLDTGHGSDVERLPERLRVCRSVLEDDTPSFSGAFYSIAGAANHPRPVQDGGIPVVVSVGPDPSLRHGALSAAADVVDAVIVAGSADEVRDAVEKVQGVTDDRDGPAIPPQVLWLGPFAPGVESRSPAVADLVAECRSRLAAGADGCIVMMDGSTVVEQFRHMERVGRELGG
jgi:alkanesulfonate monooxygenase SsuD/methylene tetrahydromethanopterin reductase-like flavin-dependent oxidoreductase (luciferase family)